MAKSAIRKGYYDAPEGQIHYRHVPATTKDASKSPILFCHMCPTSSLYFEALMTRCAAEGYDCYAPDMPGFGASYNPEKQPEGIAYYVDVFMLIASHVGMDKFHVLGHHSGASVATEMAVMHPDQILSVCLIGPALLNSEEQAAVAPLELVMFNKPVADGSHLLTNWQKVDTMGWNWELLELHGQVLDTARAYEGRIQIYTCVFSQPMIELLGKVTCPVLGLSAEDDMLYSYLPRVKEIKPDAVTAIVKGGNWEVLKDPEGVCKELVQFIAGL